MLENVPRYRSLLATSMLVGIVATDEQVPNDMAAGRNSLENMAFAAPLPPPKRA